MLILNDFTESWFFSVFRLLLHIRVNFSFSRFPSCIFLSHVSSLFFHFSNLVVFCWLPASSATSPSFLFLLFFCSPSSLKTVQLHLFSSPVTITHLYQIQQSLQKQQWRRRRSTRSWAPFRPPGESAIKWYDENTDADSISILKRPLVTAHNDSLSADVGAEGLLQRFTTIELRPEPYLFKIPPEKKRRKKENPPPRPR